MDLIGKSIARCSRYYQLVAVVFTILALLFIATLAFSSFRQLIRRRYLFLIPALLSFPPPQNLVQLSYLSRSNPATEFELGL
jgi:hypothetical protein